MAPERAAAGTPVSELPQEEEEEEKEEEEQEEEEEERGVESPQSAGARHTVHTSETHRRRPAVHSGKSGKRQNDEFLNLFVIFSEAKVRSDPSPDGKTGFPIFGHVMEAPC